jgi:hypothetical protein
MLCPARSPHLLAPLLFLRRFTPPLHTLARAASPAHLRSPVSPTPAQRQINATDPPAAVCKLAERPAALSILALNAARTLPRACARAQAR